MVKNPPASAGNMRRGFDPWVGKIPWEENGNPFQYSCLENPMNGGAWQATAHGVMTKATEHACMVEARTSEHCSWSQGL